MEKFMVRYGKDYDFIWIIDFTIIPVTRTKFLFSRITSHLFIFFTFHLIYFSLFASYYFIKHTIILVFLNNVVCFSGVQHISRCNDRECRQHRRRPDYLSRGDTGRDNYR